MKKTDDASQIERKSKRFDTSEDKITARKGKGGKDNLTPFEPGVACKRYAMEKQMKAKALFLSKKGNISDAAIAKAVNASHRSVIRWRHDQKWEEELERFQAEFKEDLVGMIRDAAQSQIPPTVTDEQLVGVVQEIVGPTVATHLSEFLVRIHKADLEDLEKLNIAIRHKLTPNADGKIDVAPMAISQLVNAKINIIKGVRLILGQSTENIKPIGAGGDEEIAIAISVSPEIARSLSTLSNITDAEFTELPKENVDGE